MPATIRDIKEKTGLSLATISKYLNGGNVLPENRASIEAAIQELHYEVNEMARGLVTHRTRTVGVIVYSVESMFNGTLLRYVGESLRKNGYGMLICDSSSDVKIEEENVRFLVGKKVDGIIIVPISDNSDFLEPAEKAGIPVVMMDRSMMDRDHDCVKIDNRTAAYKAVNLLLEHNHRSIAIIGSDQEYTGLERYKGYLDALQGAACQVPEEYQKRGNHSFEYGYQSMKELLALEKPPTAVFMSNYEIALGAVMAINESGIKSPEDISLIGFDNLILSNVVKPKLYMVVQPMKEIGEQAVELLLKRMNSREKELPVEIVMSTMIQKGDSIRML